MKKIIPAIAVPAAPMPVHTAYEVPIGSPPLIALFRKKKLKVIHTAKLREGHSLEKFSEYFSETVKPISNSPPMIRNNQGIIPGL